LLLNKGLLLLTIMAGVPVEDIQPGEPQILRGRSGGRTDDDSVLNHLHRTDLNVFDGLRDGDFIVRLLLLRRHVGFEPQLFLLLALLSNK